MNQLEIVPNDTDLEAAPEFKFHYNMAQILLGSIGGTASLVAGIQGHYWADKSTPKKGHQRPRNGRGYYGVNLKDHFDAKRKRDKATT